MKKSFADMVRSLGLMAVIVAAVVLIGGHDLVFPRAADRMPAVDYRGALQSFRDDTGVAALAPVALPASWRANAARLFSPAAGSRVVHVGFATPGTRFAGLDEGRGDVGSVIAAVLGARGQQVQGSTDIDGATWDVRTSSRGERAYTRNTGSVIVIVTGNATDAQLRLLAASLS